jgi:hypothetical protein
MKPKYLLIASSALLLAGISSLWAGWHGSAAITAGYPVTNTSTVVQFAGSATGVLALIGIAGVGLGLIVLIIALIAELASDPLRRAVKRTTNLPTA